MAYQTNFGYPQYGYQNQFNPYQFQQQVVQPPVPTQPTQPQSQVFTQPQMPSLYGKVVDGIEVVKAHDLPLSQVGIFPKADLSRIYVKAWSADGSTYVNEYQLVQETKEEVASVPTVNWEEKLDDIYNSIDSLSKKMDKLKATSTPPTRKKKVEEDEEYE